MYVLELGPRDWSLVWSGVIFDILEPPGIKRRRKTLVWVQIGLGYWHPISDQSGTQRIPKPSCQRRWVRGKWPKYHDERERGKKFTPRKTGQRSKRRERRPEANEEGNETRELGNKEKGTRGTEGRSDKEKEGGGRTTEEKRRVDYKKTAKNLHIWFKKEGERSKRTPQGERTGVG